jgi:hypothetical protein
MVPGERKLSDGYTEKQTDCGGSSQTFTVMSFHFRFPRRDGTGISTKSRPYSGRSVNCRL